MKIKKCLITAAGLGTRMGEIGQSLPKPLWPIFNKTLLDLQIVYARELGVEDIYINIHHKSLLITEWAKGKDVTLLVEDDLLGSGGCIHNYKRFTNSNELLLVINSDQFYFFDKEDLFNIAESLSGSNSCAHLLAINVGKEEKYNETVIQNGKLISIRKYEGNSDYLTYSGVGVINLAKIENVDGASSFFQSVCNFNSGHVKMSLPDGAEFWDFGTLEKYYEGIFNIAKKPSKRLLNFLSSAGVKIDGVGENTIEFKGSEMFLTDRDGNKELIYRGKTIRL